MTEAELNKELMRAGMISICRPQVTLLYDRFGQRVVKLVGKPVSKIRAKQAKEIVDAMVMVEKQARKKARAKQ